MSLDSDSACIGMMSTVQLLVRGTVRTAHSVPYPPKLILNSFGDRNGGGPICYESTGREIVKPAKITGDGNFIHKLVHVPRTSLSSFLCHYTEVARTDLITQPPRSTPSLTFYDRFWKWVDTNFQR